MRRVSRAVAVLFALLAVLAAFPQNMVGYIARMAWFQAEQLWDRTPIESAIASGAFNEKQTAKLRLVAPIKEYGRRIGLKSTENYDTVAPHWKRTVWNISACEPLAFRPKSWWFPIVGRLTYIGAFREEDARWRASRLKAEGYDVYVREAGAYSTLGWFRDPVLPKMLDWTEFELANTILHELTHATLWIPGSVSFNESFAQFVGDEAAEGYMIEKYGESSAEVADLRARVADRETSRKLMHQVYEELDTLYSDTELDDGEKLVRKAAIMSSLPHRARTAGFLQPDRYVRAWSQGTWNNARFIQFRTYNESHEHFTAVYEAVGRDLIAFIDRVGALTAGRDDPYDALRESVTGDTSPSRDSDAVR